MSNQKFEKANEETLEIMLRLTHRQKKKSLDIEDIQNVPCNDLKQINKLWNDSSQGRFGFTAQKWIWIHELEGEPGVYRSELVDLFGDLVGWRVIVISNKNVDPRDLTSLL